MSEARRRLLGGLCLALLTFAAYSPALRGGFLWDDDRYVSENPLMTSPGGLGRIWALKTTDQYYPLVYSSFWLERRLWGLDPTGYHVVNVLLHILNALLIWAILRRLRLEGAWLAGAVFALHPVHVESVAWISERKNVLSGLFYLLALASYLEFEEKRGARYYFAAFGLFILALLSKTVTCTLPVVVPLLGWMRGRRVRLADAARLLPFLAVGAGAGLLTSRLEMGHVLVRGSDWSLSAWQRLMLAGKALWFYAGKLAWPARLSFNYERWTLDPSNILDWSGSALVIVVALLLWTVRGKRGGRETAAGAAFFALTLFPALGFFQVYPQRYSYVADHFQYLASAGVIAVFAGAAARRVPAGALACLLPVLGLLTWRQAHAYVGPDALWTDTLRKNPRSFIAHTNLGGLSYRRGQVDAAIEHYRAALAIDPNLLEPNASLGVALASQGKLEEAAVYLRAALVLEPGYVEGLNLLGKILAAQGRWDEAMRQYRSALEHNPRFVDAYLNIGDALLAQGRHREAAESYARVLWINENLPAAVYDRAGQAYAGVGARSEAIRHFQEALRIDPALESARRHLKRAP